MIAALGIWLTGTAARIAVSVLAQPYLGTRPSQVAPAVFGWNQWDARLYIDIALHGYDIGPGYPAFFPLYPILIRLGDAIFPGDAVVSAVIISNLAAFGALTLLYRLASFEFGPRVARRATLYLAVFPMSFFLFIGYNESLFIMLTLGTLYACRRGHWWIAGTLAGFASATRLFGILLILPMSIEYLRQYGWKPLLIRWPILSLALAPAGLIAYSGYCWRVLGNPLAFSTAQDQWGRKYTVPGGAWFTAIGQLFHQVSSHSSVIGSLLEAGTALGVGILLLLCTIGRWRLRSDQL